MLIFLQSKGFFDLLRELFIMASPILPVLLTIMLIQISTELGMFLTESLPLVTVYFKGLISSPGLARSKLLF